MPDPLATNHLQLPYIAAAQAQKHVTHNEALRLLDTVVQLAVLDSTLAAPPGAPGEGERYIVAASATDAWNGHDGDVATWVDGVWEFAEPDDGWLAFDLGAEAILVWLSGAWQPATASAGVIDHLGINATADSTNRLSVRSEAVLFSAIEAGDGGNGDVRFTVNKETDTDTASLLFQSGWSGRAEIGLAGDTDFVFKVSPDGAAWTEAIRIDKDTGLPTILYDNATSGLAASDVQAAIDEIAAASGGGGAVASVFGRTGSVAAAASDYDASQVDNDSSVSGSTVKDALNALNTSVSGKQASDSDLTAIAALTPTNDDIIQRKAGAWANRTMAQLKADLAIGAPDIVSGVSNTEFGYLDGVTSAIQTQIDGKQAAASTLTSWAAITRASGFDTFVVTPSSANLRSLLSDESGTGAAYFQGGDLGTPSAGNLANASGLPVSGITASTAAALGVGSLELGHASDTTIARASAGHISVEGTGVPLNATTETHTAQQIELGHATDTTLTRASAGHLAVEGVGVALNATTEVHTAQQIELGHTSDTTITRTGAGDIAVEGNAIYRAGGTDVPVTDGGTGASTASAARSNLGAAATGANTDITSLLLNQTGLVVKGASANGLTLKPNETLSAGRTLNIVTGDADRSLTLTGNASISGTNTGDQTVPVIVSQVNASASATLDFALTSGYRCYHLELDNIKPATDDVALYFRVGTGGTPTYQTSGYYWGSTNTRGNVTFAQGSTSAGQIQTGPDTGGSAGVGNATGESISGWIEFSRPDATDFMQVSWHLRYVRADGTPAMSTGSGHWATAGVVTACRIFMSSGNISSGKATLIGKP